MSNKFTEEQYQNIVDISDKYKEKNAFGIIGGGAAKTIGSELDETTLSLEIDFYEKAEEIMAIANPRTREWAHNKYVEKEKKFVWNSKNPLNDGDFVRLYKDCDGDIVYVIVDDNVSISSDELLTFKEVINSIFDVNMFNKKEMK